MDLKDSFSNKVKKAARIIPGIGSYQDKEKLRDIDQRLRSHIASIINKERKRIDELKNLFTKELKFDPLDDLDRLARKMDQLSDTIKFAVYGYAPIFDQAIVDEKRLEELFNFDQSLEKELLEVKAQVDILVSSPEKELNEKIKEVELSLNKLEDKLKMREEFLKQVK